jgi:hypothetical protein
MVSRGSKVERDRPKQSSRSVFRRPRLLVRFVVPSDTHSFVGRVFDLSIGYAFGQPLRGDLVYVAQVEERLAALVLRVESLNLASSLLWPENLPKDFASFPVSRHEWLTVAADVFLMRHISTADCALLLVNAVLELGLDSRGCRLRNVRMKGIPPQIDQLLLEMLKDQGDLRVERNARVHHGEERAFTSDDTTFKIAAAFERRGIALRGTDQFDREIDLDRSFKEGLIGLQRDSNRSNRRMIRTLDKLYVKLWREFESRWATHRLAMHPV